MSNEDESTVDRLIESAYMRENRREVTAEDEVEWLSGIVESSQAIAQARWGEIVRLRHDRKIYGWTIVVLVASNLLAYRPWEWLR